MARERANGDGAPPAAVIGHRMIPDTEARSLSGCSIDHLGEADGARGRRIDRQRIEAPSPAPIRAFHRIAGAFDLRQRGQEFGRDCAGGIGAKEGSVLPPGFRRLLVERRVEEEEQLGGFADDLIGEVRQGESEKQDYGGNCDAQGAWDADELAAYPPCSAPPEAKTKEGEFGFFWHRSWRSARRLKPVGWVDLLRNPSCWRHA